MTLAAVISNRVIAPNRAVLRFESATQSSTFTTDKKRFRVAAYNIAHARGPQVGTSNWAGDRSPQLNELANVIASWDTDVVILNEVDFDATWSGRINQARWIAKRAGYPYRVEQRNYDVSAPFFRMRFGNAVLSRWPIIETKRIALPAVASWEHWFGGKKDALLVTLDVLGTPIHVVAVHLEVRDRSIRQQSVPILAQAMQARPGPLIFAGDLNCQLQPGTAVTRLGDETSLTLPPQHMLEDTPGSFPGLQPNRLIDFILATPGLKWTHFVVSDAQLSDHRPVIAEFNWPPAAIIDRPLNATAHRHQ